MNPVHQRGTSWSSRLLLVGFISAVVLANQFWVGSTTIYDPQRSERRIQMHESILHNQPPPGAESWDAIGANGTNIRILTVYLVEAVHRSVGLSVPRVYWMVETASLFLFLLTLFFYLRWWFDPPVAALGLAYVGMMLPLTYFFHFFHPWDKPSWFVWVVLLLLLRSERLGAFAAVLFVSILIKFDTVVLPALYWLSFAARGKMVRTTLITAALLVLSFGTYWALSALIPGGAVPRSAGRLALDNLRVMADLKVSYPPLLMFAVPIATGIAGWRRVDRFSRATFGFGLGLLLLYFLQTHFVEVRAEIPLLVLMLPCALGGVSAALEVPARPVRAAFAQSDRGIKPRLGTVA
jgi:hypothetical protein